MDINISVELRVGAWMKNLEGWGVKFGSFWQSYVSQLMEFRYFRQLVVRNYSDVRCDGRNRTNRSKVAIDPS